MSRGLTGGPEDSLADIFQPAHSTATEACGISRLTLGPFDLSVLKSESRNVPQLTLPACGSELGRQMLRVSSAGSNHGQWEYLRKRSREPGF